MRFYLYTLVLLLIFVACQRQKHVTGTDKPKPNIIYILADDLGYGEVGAYGQTRIETPNIDALAKAGMLFTQHYSGAPVCAPARAVLLTGKHLGHAYIRGNDEWAQRGTVWKYKAAIRDSTLEGQRPLPEHTVTLPRLLKKAGYATGMVGKWGLGAPHTASVPTKMGFDYFFGYNCQRQAHTYNPVHLYENEHRVWLGNDTLPPSTGLTKGEDPFDPLTYRKYNQAVYAPTLMFEKLMGFVEQHKTRPFFLYWASPIPHLPLQAPEKWVQYYVDKFGEEPPYYYVEGETRGSYYPARYPHASYAAMVSYLDENIGKLVAYLKKEGLYDNTLIVFSSDNGPSYTGGTDSPWFDSGGPFNSEYGRGKGFLYEGGIRVPMIVSWPKKVRAGTTTDHISAFWDVLPTLCEIAHVESPPDTDGISFLNTLTKDSRQRQHEYLYWEYPEYNGQVAVRLGDWKILWKDIQKENKEIELYDLKADRAEQHNLAGKHPEIVEKLLEIIKKEHYTPEIERFRMEGLEAVSRNK
ncbi:MAG: N-acetylgalactosamine-6-sulfatase [Bacteroidetes bacterium]|nr:MAG: N-acetylgalactosamine-6-sulfatase [Bacteroidota bacterium]